LAYCERMSRTTTENLFVIIEYYSHNLITTTGDAMNIRVTQPILESIFFKNSPLHDGAIVIQENYITATRVILPVSNDRNIPLRFGLRHRAAMGIAEETDAVCLVVSEETGSISYIKDGHFVPYKDTTALIALIMKDLE